MAKTSPFIQVSFDAVDGAQAVAGTTGLSVQQVLGGLTLLWRWCWRSKVDQVDGLQLSGHFGANNQDLPGALVSFGFLAPEDGGRFRVRGADKYLRLQEARRKGGLAAKANLIPGAIHRRKNCSAGAEAQPKPSPRTSPAPQSGDDRPLQRAASSEQPDLLLPSEEEGAQRPPAPEKASPPRQLSVQERFAANFAKRRSEVLGVGHVADTQLGAARLNRELAWLKGPDLETAEGQELVTEAAEIFLGDPYRLRQDPPFSLLNFSRDRATYLSKAQRKRGAA